MNRHIASVSLTCLIALDALAQPIDSVIGPNPTSAESPAGASLRPAEVEVISLGKAFPLAVSADGSTVVGAISHGSPGPFEAFRWTSHTGVQPLGSLAPGSSAAHGVSADGAVIVGYTESAEGRVAFRWTETTGMEPLGDLPGGDDDSAAIGVSDDGSVIVGTGSSASGYEAFRWTEAQGMQGLGLLPGDKSNGIAHGVSGDGAVIVGDRYGGGDGWRWSAAAGFQTLPGGYTGGAAANHDGSIIVGYCWNELEENKQPARWEDGALEFLGLLPEAGAGASGGATHMSSDGGVIIGWSDSAHGQETFLWTRSRGIESLAELVAALGEPALLDERPGQAGGASADGRVLGAWGYGGNEGWIIIMPNWFPCLADCDGSGALDVFDFLCFQDLFATGSPGADCDSSGELDVFDFLCFQNEFAAGCP